MGAADKLRGHMDAAEYKHVVLGLIFLKYISRRLPGAVRPTCSAPRPTTPTRRTATSTLAENIFWVPPEARWA